jgi:uncharacterized protein YwgA
MKSGIFSSMNALFEAFQSSQNEAKREDYDPGKYGPHIEKLTEHIFGVYDQTYDSPEGDIWRAEIIDTRKGLEVVAEKQSDYRFLHNPKQIHDELAKILVCANAFANREDVVNLVKGWRWGKEIE